MSINTKHQFYTDTEGSISFILLRLQLRYPYLHLVLRQGQLLDGVREVCRIKTDMSCARDALTKQRGPFGTWWKLEYQIVLFGKTELTAQFVWLDSKVCA
jgi:hypothetical protein